MPLFLGLDSSTQGIKAVLIDPAQGKIILTLGVNYEADLPEFGCQGGVLPHPDPLVKHADPLLWLAGLDLILARLQLAGAPMTEVKGIGGSGQQHGSVYLNARFFEIVANLQPDKSLPAQIQSTLSRKTAPIWMDSSTGTECAEITQSVNMDLQAVTGSSAIERFTGPQIRKFWKTDPAGFAATRRIHLVSSFLCSVLCGADAPIDSGDGAGMNLADLKCLQWEQRIAEATAPRLIEKLPRLVAGSECAGNLAPYFAKYGLTPGIPVAMWTGDNPASLVGCGAVRSGVAVISLGTSDTFFAAMDSFKIGNQGFGHVFGHPAGGFMSLTCFKNGSLARQRIKEDAGVDWHFFGSTAFAKTPVGNEKRWALPWLEPEITPLVKIPGLRANFDFPVASLEVKIRAVVEAQAMAMRTYSLWMGDFSSLRVTGGASQSQGILQTLADVFDAPVEIISTADSAALGAAFIATHVANGYSFETLASVFCPAIRRISPNAEAAGIYRQLLFDFQQIPWESLI